MSEEAAMVTLLNNHMVAFEGGSWLSKIRLIGDTKFRTPTTGTWLAAKPKFVPPKEIGSGEHGIYRLQGNYEIEVNEANPDGAIAAIALAGRLVKHFHRGLVLNSGLSSVKIEFSHQSDAIEGKSLLTIPVTARFWGYDPY